MVVSEKRMYKRYLIIRQFKWIAIAVFLLNFCQGQHYFFEEIKQLNLTHTDPDQKKTDSWDSYDNESTITLENATFEQEDDNEQPVTDKIKFPEFYHAQGIISLPYDGIIEPFEAWYSGGHNMSRIDYYYGKETSILAK